MSKIYDIKVQAKSKFIEHLSDHSDNHYVFTYTVTLTNCGKIGARLLRRHWYVSDSFDQIHEVEGDGVLGEQPHIAPGDTYQYASGTVIETPVGTMEGCYHLIADDGTPFVAEIPTFILSAKHKLH